MSDLEALLKQAIERSARMTDSEQKAMNGVKVYESFEDYCND